MRTFYLFKIKKPYYILTKNNPYNLFKALESIYYSNDHICNKSNFMNYIDVEVKDIDDIENILTTCPIVHEDVLDINTTEIVEYYSQPQYMDITTSPNEDILVTDGYGIEMFVNSKVEDMETIVVPVQPDNLRFIEWKENILKVNCYEFLVWGKEIELYLDIETKEWLN